MVFKKINLGNIDVKETGVMQKIMLKQCVNASTKKPKDYVIATGVNYTVRDFINEALKVLKIKVVWKERE